MSAFKNCNCSVWKYVPSTPVAFGPRQGGFEEQYGEIEFSQQPISSKQALDLGILQPPNALRVYFYRGTLEEAIKEDSRIIDLVAATVWRVMSPPLYSNHKNEYWQFMTVEDDEVPPEIVEAFGLEAP